MGDGKMEQTASDANAKSFVDFMSDEDYAMRLGFFNAELSPIPLRNGPHPNLLLREKELSGERCRHSLLRCHFERSEAQSKNL